jgi:hypothetical protein
MTGRHVNKFSQPVACPQPTDILLYLCTLFFIQYSADDCLLGFQDNEQGIGVTVADARFMKPLDTDLIRDLVASHDVLITVSHEWAKPH